MSYSNDDLNLMNQCRLMGASCTCLHLRKASRAVTAMFDEHFAPLGIRITQFGLLVSLYALHSASVNQLAEFLVMDRTTLTRNLKVIAEAGLVEETRGSDRRTRLWSLTALGHQRFQEGIPYWEKAQNQVVETLGSPLVGNLNKMLKEVSTAFP